MFACDPKRTLRAKSQCATFEQSLPWGTGPDRRTDDSRCRSGALSNQHQAYVPVLRANQGETMTEVAKSRLSRPHRLRAVALTVTSAGTLFWLYTFYGIAQVPIGDGSGFQWIAVIPLGLIFLVFTLPALILALIDRLLWFSLILGCVGLIAFAYLWKELLGEFYH